MKHEREIIKIFKDVANLWKCMDYLPEELYGEAARRILKYLKKPESPSLPVERVVSPQAIEEILERIKNCMPGNPYWEESTRGKAWDKAFDMIWRNIESEFEIDLAG